MKLCPYCKIENPLVNHIRWCKSHPNYEQRKIKASENARKCFTSSSALEHNLKNLKSSLDLRCGEYVTFKLSCIKCESHFELIKRSKSDQSKFKKYCSSKCANSRIFSEETKRKQSESNKLFSIQNPLIIRIRKFKEKIVKEKVRKIRLIKFGPPKPVDTICKICNTYFKQYKSSTVCSKECYSKSQSKRMKGKTGGYRTKSGTSKFHGSYYKDIWMDSSWELTFAKRCDDSSINWIRNNDMSMNYICQDGQSRKYYPDFYLPDYNLYIEIKGYWTDKVRHKMNEVQKQYDNILILDKLDKIKEFSLVKKPLLEF